MLSGHPAPPIVDEGGNGFPAVVRHNPHIDDAYLALSAGTRLEMRFRNNVHLAVRHRARYLRARNWRPTQAANA